MQRLRNLHYKSFISVSTSESVSSLLNVWDHVGKFARGSPTLSARVAQ